jgi:hypothetical protein
VDSRVRRSTTPFAVVGVVLVLVSLTLFQLPESFVSRLERNRALNDSQAGWAYRLLILFALAQAVYGGFLVLQVERVAAARRKDAKLRRMTRQALLTSLTRSAAAMTLLTLVYGIASFVITGQRGGFWAFPLIFVAQGAWYFRQTGELAKWLEFQPETEPEDASISTWEREPPDYSPPLAR